YALVGWCLRRFVRCRLRGHRTSIRLRTVFARINLRLRRSRALLLTPSVSVLFRVLDRVLDLLVPLLMVRVHSRWRLARGVVALVRVGSAWIRPLIWILAPIFGPRVVRLLLLLRALGRFLLHAALFGRVGLVLLLLVVLLLVLQGLIPVVDVLLLLRLHLRRRYAEPLRLRLTDIRSRHRAVVRRLQPVLDHHAGRDAPVRVPLQAQVGQLDEI